MPGKKINNMQTVLVAGGGGFIGSHLCKSLLSDNFKVICVDNFVTSNKRNVEELLPDKNFRLIEQDITKSFEPGEKIDFIFHLASPASPNAKSPRSYINFPVETLLANSQGTHMLLDLARENKSKFLYVSSSEIYGDPEVSPQKEDYFGNVNPNGPRSVYDESKRFGEAITMAYFRKFGLNIRIIRIFNTYGPKMQKDDGRVVSNFINQALWEKDFTIYGDGSQTRSFCYVDDMVSGLKLAMFKDGTQGKVYNLGNPDERSVKELADIIKKLTGSESKIIFEELPFDDPKTRRPDIERAKEELGWEPMVRLEEGLQRTIEYFRSL